MLDRRTARVPLGSLTHKQQFSPETTSPRKEHIAPVVAARSDLLWYIGLLIHIPLGYLLAEHEWLSTGHAYGVLILALGILVLDRNSERAVRRTCLISGYIIGAEVLWRMTDARIFWEYGKYAVVLILGLGLLRRARSVRIHPVPLLYLMLLIPAVAMWAGADWSEIRNQLSFNLSGPLALAVSTIFFAGYTVDADQRRVLLRSLLMPIIAIASVALRGVFAAPVIVFGTEANFAASGGFGPNQVSSALGLGMVVCWFLLLQERKTMWRRLFFAIVMLWLLAQALLTFSRGGVYGALLAMAAGIPFLFAAQKTQSAHHLRFLLALAAVGLIVQFALLPRLDHFTGGALSIRFTNLDTTGRFELASVQWQLWQAHPLSGVGPGKAKDASLALFGRPVASHTEISRLPAEHGIFGMAALLVLAIGGLRVLWNARPGLERAFVASCLAWVLLYVLSNAMRTVAPSFLYGITWAVAVRSPWDPQ